jgi:hypothetical protein
MQAVPQAYLICRKRPIGTGVSGNLGTWRVLELIAGQGFLMELYRNLDPYPECHVHYWKCKIKETDPLTYPRRFQVFNPGIAAFNKLILVMPVLLDRSIRKRP